jgi:hypothetical protein
MHTTALLRTVRRMADRVGRQCPECAGWPDTVGVRLIEEIISADEPLPPPAPPAVNPWAEPCPCCGRRHKPAVIWEGD